MPAPQCKSVWCPVVPICISMRLMKALVRWNRSQVVAILSPSSCKLNLPLNILFPVVRTLLRQTLSCCVLHVILQTPELICEGSWRQKMFNKYHQQKASVLSCLFRPSLKIALIQNDDIKRVWKKILKRTWGRHPTLDTAEVPLSKEWLHLKLLWWCVSTCDSILWCETWISWGLFDRVCEGYAERQSAVAKLVCYVICCFQVLQLFSPTIIIRISIIIFFLFFPLMSTHWFGWTAFDLNSMNSWRSACLDLLFETIMY